MEYSEAVMILIQLAASDTQTFDVLFNAITLILTGIVIWLFYLTWEKSRFSSKNSAYSGKIDALIVSVDELKQNVKELNTRFDIFTKNEIDELKELSRNMNKGK